MTSVDLTGADMRNGNNETQFRLQIVDWATYLVTKDEFPRIIRDNRLPIAVTKVKYYLSIPALAPWMIKD